MKRVAITGQGTINALGSSVKETFAAFQNGTLGISEMDFPDVDRLKIRLGGQVKGFDPKDHFARQEVSLYDRFTQFAVFAAREAVGQAGLTFEGELAEQSGVILGNAGGGFQTQDESYNQVYAEGKNRVHPFVVPRVMNSAAASHLSIIYNLQGPTFSVSTACASSNHAMGQAFQMIRSGIAPVIVTGGSESTLCFGGIKAWEGLRVMSPDACRPFSANRNGMLQGEGAAIFVFEEYEHAKARGADILAEVAGFSMTSDAFDIVMPSTKGAMRAMRGAMKDAGLAPEQIGYVNAHGTGTKANDRTECQAISEAFGSHAEKLLVSSTKSMHGHIIGGTGAVELLASIMALNTGVIAPTISFDKADPDCPLDVVPNEARQAKVSATLSNSFAFGGLNAVLALKSL